MTYNINFCIISAAYLCITAFFYKRQTHIASRRSRLFDAMLQCGILSLALDIAAAAIDPYARMFPALTIYFINIVFLMVSQTTGVLFFFYSINLTGTYLRMKKSVRVLIMLPLLVIAALILLSPFSHMGVFYLDENHIYHHGVTHAALYIIMGMYLVSSLVIVFVRRRRLQKFKFYSILAFLAATLAAMLIQLNHPYLLVNSTANAFALTLMYYVLEAPSAHIDALTNVLNRTALLPVLRDVFEEGERCSLLLFSLESLYIANHTFGMKGGDEALIAFARYLKETYPKAIVLRVEGDVFCALLRQDAYIGRDRLALLQAQTPGEMRISVGEATLDPALSCINSEDCASAAEMSGLLDSLLSQRRAGGLEHVLVADAAFKMRLTRQEAIERAMVRALDEDRVEVYYQPIHDASGRLCALEALARISDRELGMLPTQEFVELAERNGSILRLGECVLRKTCAFIRANHLEEWGLDHVGVNLSAVQCVQEDMVERIGGILEEYAVPDGLIAFEITETATGMLTAVRENMEKLTGRGIHFLLDDFGTGYANFKNMTALPFRCIKLDKSLLWNAHESEDRMRLLSGVVKIVHTLGLSCLCEGVETREQAALLSGLGVSMLQGFYFSKPLERQALLAYAGKAGEVR